MYEGCRGSVLRGSRVPISLGKVPCNLGNVEEAKNLVRRVFKLNGSFKADFLDDPAFDSVWESF